MNQEPRHFADELDQVKQRLLVMAGLAQERVSVSLRALVERDREGIAEIISGDQAINDLHLGSTTAVSSFSHYAADGSRSQGDRRCAQDQHRP